MFGVCISIDFVNQSIFSGFSTPDEAFFTFESAIKQASMSGSLVALLGLTMSVFMCNTDIMEIMVNIQGKVLSFFMKIQNRERERKKECIGVLTGLKVFTRTNMTE